MEDDEYKGLVKYHVSSFSIKCCKCEKILVMGGWKATTGPGIWLYVCDECMPTIEDANKYFKERGFK